MTRDEYRDGIDGQRISDGARGAWFTNGAGKLRVTRALATIEREQRVPDAELEIRPVQVQPQRLAVSAKREFANAFGSAILPHKRRVG